MKNKMIKEKENTGTKLSYLLIGGGIGAIIALLFAPKAGHELRTNIADATRKGLDKSEEIAGELSEKAQTVYGETKTKAVEIYDSAKQKLNSATTAISEIPADLQTAIENTADQISTTIEAGKKEYDHEKAVLNQQSMTKTTY